MATTCAPSSLQVTRCDRPAAQGSVRDAMGPGGGWGGGAAGLVAGARVGAAPPPGGDGAGMTAS